MMASSILIYDDNLIDEINSMDHEQVSTDKELFTDKASLDNEADRKAYDLAKSSNLNVDANTFVPRNKQNSFDFNNDAENNQTTYSYENEWYKASDKRENSPTEDIHIYPYLNSLAGYDLDNIFIFDIQFVNTSMSEICIWNNRFSTPGHIIFPNKFKFDTESNKRNKPQTYSNSSREPKKRRYEDRIDPKLYHSLLATDPIAVSKNKTQHITGNLEWALEIVNNDSIFVCRTNNRKDTTKLYTPSLEQNKIFHMQNYLSNYNKTAKFMVFPLPLPKYGATCVGHYRDNKKCALRNVCFILESYFSEIPEMLNKIYKQFTVYSPKSQKSQNM